MKLSDKSFGLAAVGSEWILWLLVGLSLISVAVMIERIIFYQSMRRRDTDFLRSLHSALADNDPTRAQALVKNSTAPGGRIATQPSGPDTSRPSGADTSRPSGPDTSSDGRARRESDLVSDQSHVNTLWESMIVLTDQKNWDKADTLFNEIRSYAKSKNMRFMDLHLMYANYLIKNNESERSLRHLKFLNDIFIQVVVTEDSFLGIRGIPSFGDYLTVLEAYFSSASESQKNLSLLEDLVCHVDSEGETAVNDLLKRIKL